MDNISYDILNYAREKRLKETSNVMEMLKEKYPDVTMKALVLIFNDLQREDFIERPIFNSDPMIGPINELKPVKDFPEPIKLVIRNDGITKLEEHEIRASTLATNHALKDSSDSNKDLNTKTKTYYTAQKNTGYIIAGVTIVSLLLGIFNFIKSYQKPIDPILQLSPNTQLELDKTLKFQTTIDSLVRKVVSDSLKKRQTSPSGKDSQ